MPIEGHAIAERRCINNLGRASVGVQYPAYPAYPGSVETLGTRCYAIIAVFDSSIDIEIAEISR